ncbi:chemotaxis protein CheA [Desulfitibacter alkalitolerans]|uniref:chemotaxis protein CheA n=1 Tax=Desulfitibacter alkalitolerans TaxID=264641 RepID=UPI000488E20D|nr:chemotaxis protein CheA [Desulfitibacter alkalitolerans]
MTSDFDMSQYLNIFLDEADEQIQLMDENILLLEKNRDDLDILNLIFRAAHTIKGSSASMGFDKMAEVTHSLENVLDLLRQDRLEVTTEIIDLLLEGLDMMKELKGDIISGKDSELDVSVLIEKLKTVMEGKRIAKEVKEETAAAQTAVSDNTSTVSFNKWQTEGAIKFDEIEENLIRTAEIKGFKVWQVFVALVPDCLMKAARAYIVYNNLKDLGEIIKTHPATEDIEAENFDLEFQMVIVTREDKDRIENIVKTVSEIDRVKVKEVELSHELDARDEEPIKIEKENSKAPTLFAEKKGEVKQEAIKTNQTVRVDVQRLENLMNLVGELVIDRIRLADVEESLRAKYGTEDLLEILEEISLHIGRISGDLQEEIMKARMFPIEQVFNRFPRMVRDLAQKAEKEIEFIVEGRETELDRTVIEEIGDPLIHLLRNAIDHGIEPPEVRKRANKPTKGTVKLKAFHQENQIIITVEDDGKGIDTDKLIKKALSKGLITEEKAGRLTQKEALNLIFIPGFSTAESVSSVSGRGVGMDIVRNHIERINGMVEISTNPGKGTKFTIRLPLTLAINRSLLVKLGNQVYAFPLANVVEIVDIPLSEVRTVAKQEVAVVRGDVLPLYTLQGLLDLKIEKLDNEKYSVVVVGLSEKRIGIIVDDLIGEQEIVIKTLGDYIGKIPGLAGATIMGDGTVALILDIRGMMDHTRMDD